MDQESSVDLLIIGAGPAGLMMACWASQFDIKARIIDKKSTRVQTGRADGLQPRTLEIFDSFGIAPEITALGNRINEICSWNPNPNNRTEIQRTQRAMTTIPGLSRFGQIGLNQGAIEDALIRYIETKGEMKIERNTRPATLTIDQTLCDVGSDYPVRLTLNNSNCQRKDVSHQDDCFETVKAKYVVGCDGATSWVREQLGIQMEGETTEKHFGVMDIVPLTDFPDIRQSCVIHSTQGSVMTVPRENRLVRFYVQLNELVQDNHGINPSNFTAEAILAYAQSIFQPYQLDFKVCDWSSVYVVGQRLASQFDHSNRVFLAGDAAHTHSPTMGQGMNVSIQDSYNLGWKICSVLEGAARTEILSTYHTERRPVAEQLLRLDRQMAEFYSRGPSQESQEYKSFRDHFSAFISGVDITYSPSELVSMPVDIRSKHAKRSQLAQNVCNGQILRPYEVTCQASGNATNVADLLMSTGAWRILVFPGDIRRPAVLETLKDLSHTLEGLVRRVAEFHSMIQVITIHTSPRKSVNLLDLPPVYHPWHEAYGWDYWKVYTEEQAEAPGLIYDHYGISRDAGCLLVVRPDQHISCAVGFDEADVLHKHFLSIF